MDSTVRSRVGFDEGSNFVLLEPAGSDYERGLCKGRELAESITRCWEMFEPRFDTQWAPRPVDRQAWCHWLRANMKIVCPWMVAEIEGIAAGSGLTRDQVLLLNHYGLVWSTANEPQAPDTADAGAACTSIALVSPSDGPLLGQNLDLGGGDVYYMERAHLQAGTTMLGAAMAGMAWLLCGLNQHGLAVGSSSLPGRLPARRTASHPSATLLPSEYGMPFHFLVSSILRSCNTTAQAIAHLHNLTPVIPSSGGYALSLLDSDGNQAVVEKLDTRTGLRDTDTLFACTTNWVLTAETLPVCGTGTSLDDLKRADALGRMETIKRRFAKPDNDIDCRSGNESRGIDFLRDVLCAHDESGSLCNHGEEPSCRYTRLSFIVLPEKRELWITNGHPCRQEFQRFAMTN